MTCFERGLEGNAFQWEGSKKLKFLFVLQKLKSWLCTAAVARDSTHLVGSVSVSDQHIAAILRTKPTRVPRLPPSPQSRRLALQTHPVACQQFEGTRGHRMQHACPAYFSCRSFLRETSDGLQRYLGSTGRQEYIGHRCAGMARYDHKEQLHHHIIDNQPNHD